MDSPSSRSELVIGIGAAATGLGVLIFALFPLALPIVILTIVATLPLALPLVGLAAVALVLAGAWFGIRSARQGARRLGGVRNGRQLKRARASLDCG